MTAEIIDLGKYRERKNRIGKQAPSAIPKTSQETIDEPPADEPGRARPQDLRKKDGGDPS